MFVKIIVVGCGSIGRRHLKNILSLGHEVAGVDLSEEYRKWVEENLEVKTYGDLEEAIKIETPEACFVCTPPSTHIPIAKKAIEHGIHVFVEKPLSNSLEGVDELIKAAKERKLKIAIGYNLRFNKGIAKLKELVDSGKIGKVCYSRLIVGQYLPDWRPWQDYRKSYTAKKSLGGGIILDASHELDYARWIFGEPKAVTCVAKKVSSLDVETEDNADILIEFKKGSVGNVHLDFVRRDYRRGCEVVGEKGTLELFFNDKIVLLNPEKKGEEVFDVKEDVNFMYIEEEKQFLECIEKGGEPVVNAEEGKRSLQLALDAKQSAKEQRRLEAGK